MPSCLTRVRLSSLSLIGVKRRPVERWEIPQTAGISIRCGGNGVLIEMMVDGAARFTQSLRRLGSHFSYGSGAPGGIRTRNPWVRSPVLYPLSYRRTVYLLG